jgi:hypothetical protein
MVERRRESAGSGARGVVAGIDQRLAEIEGELSPYEVLIAERERLLKARATVLGEAHAGQISQEDVAGYLAEHPGSRPGDIAKHFGVSSGRVSAHLFRGKSSRFLSRGGDWYVREQRRGRGL